MKKIYAKPEIHTTTIKNNDVITLSGLIFGGDNGKSEKESFNTLFAEDK